MAGDGTLLRYTLYPLVSGGIASVAARSLTRGPRLRTMLTFGPFMVFSELPAHVALLHWAIVRKSFSGSASASLRRPLDLLNAAGLAVSASSAVAHLVMAAAGASHMKDVLRAEGLPLAPVQLRERLARALSLVLPIPRLLSRNVEVVRNVVFARVRGQPLKLDLYLPPRAPHPAALAPAVLYIHGGGWVTGHRRFASLPLLYHLASHGVAVATIDYRLAPANRFPAQLRDTKRALQWLRRHALRRRIDPENIVVAGESAGGHIALLAALTAGDKAMRPEDVSAEFDTGVQGCVDLYGFHDLLDEGGHFAARGTPDGVREFLQSFVMHPREEYGNGAYRLCSPLHRLRGAQPSSVPPMLGVHGGDDSLIPVEDGRAFYAELKQARAAETEGDQRVPDVFIELPHAKHAFNFLPSIRTLALNDAVLAFVQAIQNIPGPDAVAAAPRAKL